MFKIYVDDEICKRNPKKMQLELKVFGFCFFIGGFGKEYEEEQGSLQEHVNHCLVMLALITDLNFSVSDFLGLLGITPNNSSLHTQTKAPVFP